MVGKTDELSEKDRRRTDDSDAAEIVEVASGKTCLSTILTLAGRVSTLR